MLTAIIWISIVVDAATAASFAIPLAVGAAFVLAAALGAGLLLLLAWAARRAPLHFRWAALTSFALLCFSLTIVPIGRWVALALVVSTFLVAAATGGALGALLGGSWRASGRLMRAATVLFAAAGCGAIATAAVWLYRAGPSRDAVPHAALPSHVAQASPSLDNPGSRGPHKVQFLTYGAGTDLHRPEFGDGATLRTKPVDGSKVLKGWSGFTGWARTRLWGFDARQLPLNGRVWYPDGAGPFPLVLIVHGNHLAADFSDPGYEYLGTLLASRGYILVSVDENFLNSLETDVVAGLERENNARAWVLLEHLRVWHAWNADEKGPFFHKVDTERIALIGHSRGGEAAAHAAAFSRLPYNPDNARAKFNYGYHIKSVVAIAPADGQYRPAGTRTKIADINYLVVQGALDGDVSSFMGLNQFDRVAFTGAGDWFKAAIYVDGANHGQFNTTWGAFDGGAGIPKRVLNTGVLLDAESQRRVLQVFLAAFLDATLRDEREYRRLFQDWRFGAAWLPPTGYTTQYADATMQPIAAFDEDLDLTTATVAGGQTVAENFTVWREAAPKLRATVGEDRAVVLGWDREYRSATPHYRVSWPEGAFRLSDTSVLSFCLADADEDATPDDEDENDANEDGKGDTAARQNAPDAADKDEDEESDKPRQPIELTVELIDAAGHVARLPLSHFAPLAPQLETPYLKAEWLHPDALSEPILQTFRFPLADFRAANAEFDPAATTALRLVFDRTKSGVVIFDKAAFGATAQASQP
ncbi:MAG: alpha/beta hydrolase family protein [Pirellulales bacterium]